MATTKGITALQRLALYELAACARWQTGRLIAPITVNNLGDRLERGPSTVRSVIGALCSSGLISRSSGQNVAELDITPAALAAGFRAASPSEHEHHLASTENPAGAPQKSGGAELPIEIDSNKFNYINNLDLSVRPSGFPASEFAEILAGIRTPEVRAGLPREADISVLADALPAGNPANWTPTDIAAAILRVPAFSSDAEGPAVAPSLVRMRCQRLGRLALTEALSSLIFGRKTKGLYIHAARADGTENDPNDPDVVGWKVLREIQAAAGRARAARRQPEQQPRQAPPASARPAQPKTFLRQVWDESGGAPTLAGEFARIAQRTLRSPQMLPPLRNS